MIADTTVATPEPAVGHPNASGSDVDPMAYDVLLDERMADLLGPEAGCEPPYDESDDKLRRTE